MKGMHEQKVTLKKHAVRGVVSILAVLLLLAPFSYTTFQKQEAYALLGGLLGGEIVFDPANFTQNSGLLEKEFLDGITNTLAKKAVQQMTSSIVQWINSGFQGSPAFVTDMEGFLLDVADQAAGKFFTDAGLNGLCTPFQFSVSAAIEMQYYQSSGQERYACTLSDALQTAMDDVNSIGDAMNGWGDWLAVTTIPQNNQYGAYMLAQQDLNANVAEAEANAKQEVAQGNGFLSFKTCIDIQGRKECRVVTPGSVISEQLNKSLGAGQDALISADEINEVVSALFGQLAQQAITGIGGLGGLTQNSGGSSSYLNRLEIDNEDQIGFSNASSNPMEQALENEYDAQAIYQSILATLRDIEQDAIAEGCSPTLSRRLSDERQEIQALANNNRSTITQLQTLSSQYANASSQSARDSAYQQYLTLSSRTELHSEFDLLNLEFEINAVEIEGDQFLNSCN